MSMGKLRLAIGSDSAYRACLPDDPLCRIFYGSESYHCILADALAKRGHDVCFFAPPGSTLIKGENHPTWYYNGYGQETDVFAMSGVDPKHADDWDCFIDMTQFCDTVQYLFYHQRKTPYLTYRNGHSAVLRPLIAENKRNYLVPSKANQGKFAEYGFDSKVVYYGIPEFYNSQWTEFDDRVMKKYGLERDSYYLYLNRPHASKGIDRFLKLAEMNPNEKFVMAWATTFWEHQQYEEAAFRYVADKDLRNVQYIALPFSPKHHYVKRALMRGANFVLFPLAEDYWEGFGLLQAESIACGTPIMVSDQPSQRELWREHKDAWFCKDLEAFDKEIKDRTVFGADPVNRYTVDAFAESYENLIKLVMEGNSW